MILYIAEKPSLGRAIAQVLPKPHKKQQGYIQTANGDCVTWCVGHLLEQAEPDSYDTRYKQWRLEDLPIMPDEWKWQEKSKTRSQLKVIKGLLKQASEVVHAGDPDREGQLLVDEVLAYLKLDKTKMARAKRLLVNDLNPSAIKKALSQMRMNKEFVPLSTSALARSRADWLYGINMTRAYTLQGRKVGYQGVLSVGRVQTPVLGLVVRRDHDIQHFQSLDYFQVEAHLLTQQGAEFTALWVPSEACQPHMDEEGRVLNKALAQNVAGRITDQAAQVLELDEKTKTESQPLPFNLSQLQMAAARRFGLSAKQTLDICQSLYEKHQAITYPRSDCRYLPMSHFAQGKEVLAAVRHNTSGMEQEIQDADLSIKSRAWNDAKVDAHHGIIPTARTLNHLSGREKDVYELVARQYLAQFYPKYSYKDMRVLLDIAGGKFKASSQRVLEVGFKRLFPSKEEPKPQLPQLAVGETLHCREGVVLEKQTQPPKPFNEASLLAAMTGISRYVQDKSIKKVLKETDGLGTEATRAGIIDLLFKRGFLQRQGKTILATDAGKGLIASLPLQASLPDMTAQWESQLDGISQKESHYQAFMGPMQQSLCQLIEEAGANLPQALAGVSAPKKRPFKKKRQKSYKK